MTPTRGTALRPVLATTEIVALGLVAHAGAGGSLPPTGVLLALVGMVGAVSVALHLQLVRLTVAASLTVAAQVAVHVMSPGVGAGHGSGHAHLTTPEPADDRMLLAHVTSALVTVLALMCQERAAGILVRTLVPLLRAVPPRPTARPVPMHDRPRNLGRRTFELAPRRGPPAAAAPAVS